MGFLALNIRAYGIGIRKWSTLFTCCPTSVQHAAPMLFAEDTQECAVTSTFFFSWLVNVGIYQLKVWQLSARRAIGTPHCCFCASAGTVFPSERGTHSILCPFYPRAATGNTFAMHYAC
eukprot:scaffold78195_cov24-Tisochrysis_lutea.AAC.1